MSAWKGKQLMGYTEHLMRRECISIPEYRKEIVEPFNPTGVNLKEWMKYVHEAGMKFFIITAKQDVVRYASQTTYVSEYSYSVSYT